MALAITASVAAPADAQMEPYKGSAEFEQLKSLIGVWEGEMPRKAKGGEEPSEDMPMMKMTVEYRLTAGGSAIQETINRGSPMEMVSMYHDRGARTLIVQLVDTSQPLLHARFDAGLLARLLRT